MRMLLLIMLEMLALLFIAGKLGVCGSSCIGAALGEETGKLGFPLEGRGGELKSGSRVASFFCGEALCQSSGIASFGS